MNRLFIVSAIGLIALWPHFSNAKPLSYPGGVMVMQENDQTGNTLSVDYTFRSALRARHVCKARHWR
jgi:hypothetical protein